MHGFTCTSKSRTVATYTTEPATPQMLGRSYRYGLRELRLKIISRCAWNTTWIDLNQRAASEVSLSRWANFNPQND